MIIQCCECKKILAEKEPLENTTISHTWCFTCTNQLRAANGMRLIDESERERKEKGWLNYRK